MNKFIQPDIHGSKAGMLIINRTELAKSAGFSSESELVEKAFSVIFKQIWMIAKNRAGGIADQVTDQDLVAAATSILFKANHQEMLQ